MQLIPLITLSATCICTFRAVQAAGTAWSWFGEDTPPPATLCPTQGPYLPCVLETRWVSKQNCHRRGCCYKKDIKDCVLPIAYPGRTVCQAGCENIRVSHGDGVVHVENTHKPYHNNEFATIQILGPCELIVDKIDVERPKLCRFDFLRISSVPVCYATVDPIQLSEKEHTVEWRTDAHVVAQGFHFHVRPSSRPSLPLTFQEPYRPIKPLSEMISPPLPSAPTQPLPPQPSAPTEPLPHEPPPPPSPAKETEPAEKEVTLPKQEADTEKHVPATEVKSTKETRLKKPSADTKSLKALAQTVGGGLTTAVIGGVIANKASASQVNPPSNKWPDQGKAEPQNYQPGTASSWKTTIIILAVAGGLGAIGAAAIAYCCIRKSRHDPDPLAAFATSYDYNVVTGRIHVPRSDRQQ